MKSVLRLLLVSLVTLTFAGVGFAQATPATPATPAKKVVKKEEKPRATRVLGEVISVDAKAGMLTVKVKDKEMSFAAETKGALGKVKVGDKVRVSYGEKEGKLIARSITEARPKTEMAKKAEKKEQPKAEKK
ncbi:MAG: hypothetical protein A2038_01325 [Deltaproteobacteria bacterium GWA2_57_13]|nr:MAG: hypothetical protein A2038_01325 [Deltaproteobacteria bacterium GWA2_57_13]